MVRSGFCDALLRLFSASEVRYQHRFGEMSHIFLCSLGRTLPRSSLLLERLTRLVGPTAYRLLRAVLGDLTLPKKGPDVNSGSESGPEVESRL